MAGHVALGHSFTGLGSGSGPLDSVRSLSPKLHEAGFRIRNLQQELRGKRRVCFRAYLLSDTLLAWHRALSVGLFTLLCFAGHSAKASSSQPQNG